MQHYVATERRLVRIETNLHLQLGDLDAATGLSQAVAIPPLGIKELRAVDDNLRQLHPGRGAYLASNHVDPRVEAKYKPRVLSIQHQVATCEEDLARCRHGDGGVPGCHDARGNEELD